MKTTNMPMGAASFDDFSSRYFNQAYRFALRLTNNREDAEDLVQDTFVRAFQAFDRVDRYRSGEAWIMQILYRAFLDRLRTKRRRPQTVSVEALQEAHCYEEAACRRPNPEDAFINARVSEPIIEALSQLSMEQRAMFLHVVRRTPYKTMAVLFGCRIETVKSRINRITRAMQKHLISIDSSYIRYMKATNHMDQEDSIGDDHRTYEATIRLYLSSDENVSVSGAVSLATVG